jgi:glycosyltransferase involved in cell wall biosynthesis
MNAAPQFSIILATRDRAALFAEALQSVVDQTFDDTEIIVVNDGSSPDVLHDYEAVLEAARARLGARLRNFLLVRRPKGHGQSYSLNYGVEQARGDCVAFLDDDDLWIDPGHLQRVAEVLRSQRAAGRTVDLYMGNQEALRGGERLAGPIWLEALQDQLQARGRVPDAQGAYAVDIPDLMGANGFCHLNCFVVRRALWLQVGGMDEGIRWECDRDVFLRLVDTAACVLHHPAVTARHHVPDPKAGTSMTTSLNQIERRLWQVRVMDKSALGLKHPLLRAHGRLHKGYALKRIAEELAAQGDWATASAYAAQALALLPTFKWTLFTLSCFGRCWMQRLRG